MVATLVVAASCGGTEKPSSTAALAEPVPSNTAGASQAIVVRLAKKDEFAHEPAPNDGDGRRIRTGCEKSGASVTAYYQPVVAFARAHFVGKEKVAVHDTLLLPDAPKPKLGDGVNILVDPRDNVGELRIIAVGPPFYPPGDQWAENGYCLHVLREGGTTTLALEDAWNWIR